MENFIFCAVDSKLHHTGWCNQDSKRFLPYIQRQLNQSFRINVVWDEFMPNSSKASA